MRSHGCINASCSLLTRPTNAAVVMQRCCNLYQLQIYICLYQVIGTN